MKKVLLFLIVCCMHSYLANAQMPGIIFSGEKIPQKDGIAKLKILKNGNTASLEMIEDIGIVCKLYDTNKKKVSEVVTPMIQKLTQSRLRAVYEINNEIMVMVSTYEKSIPKLYRYIYDGVSGKLISEAVIQAQATMYPMSFDFRITKDPVSDYYAVVLYDSYEKDVNKKIEVIHYSPKHEVINRCYMSSPENKFKILYACDAYVNAGDAVILSTYACNTDSKYLDDAAYYLSQLKAGTTIFTNKVIAQTKSVPRPEDEILCKFIYDNKGEQFKAVMLIRTAKELNCHFISQSINSKTLEFSKKLELPMVKACEYYKKNMDVGKDFPGPYIQNYKIDQKGNDFFLAQPSTIIPTNSSSVLWLYDIGITCTSPDGQEIYGTAIPYSNMHMVSQEAGVYMDAKKGQFVLPGTDEFYGAYIELIPGKENNYLLLNNLPEKFERPENVRTATVNLAGINSADLTSFIYTFSSEGKLTKQYLFGKPTSGKDAKYALFHTGDYNQETGMYVTQVVEIVNGKKAVGVAWMTLK